MVGFTLEKADILQNVFFILCFFGAILFIFSFITQTPLTGIIAIVIFAISIPFLLIKPQRYLMDELFEDSLFATLVNLNNFIRSLNIKGKGIYLPPRINESKNYVFVPYDNLDPLSKLSAMERNRNKKLLIKEGVLLLSTGSPMIMSLEKKFAIDFSKLEMESLKETLSKFFIDELGIMNDIYVEILENRVYCIFVGSIFVDLCKKIQIEMPEFCTKLGCPLNSAVAGIISKITGRYVLIEDCIIKSDERKTETTYRLLIKR